MPTTFYNWRAAATRALLPRGAFPFVGLPPPVQFFPKDYSAKTSDSEGGMHRDGFMTYELLWTRLVSDQNAVIHRLYTDAVSGDGLFRLTCLWWDSVNPALRWVDLEGYPDLSDVAPNPPSFAHGQQVFGTIKLKLNNVSLFNDPADYS